MTILLSLLWVGFGIQVFSPQWIAIGFLISSALAVFILFTHKSFHLSHSLIWFTLFNLLLVASTLWSQNQTESLRLSLLSLSGCLWWFIGSNLKKTTCLAARRVKRSLYLATIILILLWILSIIFGWDFTVFGSNSLVIQGSSYKNHNHLGDFVLIPLLLLQLPTHIAFVAPLLTMVIVSQSRSALLGLLVGAGYIWFNQNLFQKYKKYLLVSLFAFCILFIGMSLTKTTITTRTYFFQSLTGLTKYPLGVGYGDFGRISKGNSDFSFFTHSIMFEWVSGVGYLALIGIAWLVFTLYHNGFKSTGNRAIWLPVWWAMLTVLMFDSVYTIPTYWWLFMLITGMCEDDQVR